MIDLQTVDSISHISPTEIHKTSNILDDNGSLDELNEMIKNQYIDFENLGVSMIPKNISNNDKIEIYGEMLEYINETYLDVQGLEDILISNTQLVKMGDIFYEFIVISSFNELIPEFLESIRCLNIKQFDRYFKISLMNDSSNLKTNFIKIISNKINIFLRLQQLQSSVIKDKRYQDILKKYNNYIEIINFGNSDNFVQEFLRPIIMKNESELLWRML
jgi:hypothetical protein